MGIEKRSALKSETRHFLPKIGFFVVLNHFRYHPKDPFTLLIKRNLQDREGTGQFKKKILISD